MLEISLQLVELVCQSHEEECVECVDWVPECQGVWRSLVLIVFSCSLEGVFVDWSFVDFFVDIDLRAPFVCTSR